MRRMPGSVSLSVLLLLVMVMGLLGSACAKQGAPGPTPSGQQTPPTTPQKAFKVALLTARKLSTPADLNTLEGVKRLKDELGIDVKIVECTEIAEYKEQVQAVSKEGYDVIYFLYDMFLPAVQEIAPQYPKTKYIGLWIEIPADKKQSNVKPLFFRPEQGSFVAGVMAAKMSKTGNVGFIGGGVNPGILTFLAGYEAGIKYQNPKAKLHTAWANTFEDPVKGRELASSLYSKGVDVIFQVANQTGLGVINAAKEANKYVIGVDVDQSPLAPGNVIASVLLDHGYATFDSIKQAYEGKFTADQVHYGLKEGMKVIAIPSSVPAEIKTFIDQIEKKIIAGEITVPKTTETR